MIGRYAHASDARALFQVIMALASLVLLWLAAMFGIKISVWLTLPVILLISLFNVRTFVLMHECGHGSLFRTQSLNRAFGFVLGVVSGMPQYVWSRHHSYHHSTNGNWEKYRGLYTTLSVDEYAAMSDAKQCVYRLKCSIAAAPFAGLIYIIFNPRVTWLKGSVSLMIHLVKGKLSFPELPLAAHAATFETRYWRSRKEYWHMFWNNVLLLSAWLSMCLAFGTMRFFAVYLISGSLAGAVGIVLFTVQHNFRHSYASDTEHWNYNAGAIEGTSFLIFPRWLNWFTANIGYHHVHHLSAKIPNYRLVGCHNEFQDLFSGVTRVELDQIPAALKYILWDTRARQIISVAEYREQLKLPHI